MARCRPCSAGSKAVKGGLAINSGLCNGCRSHVAGEGSSRGLWPGRVGWCSRPKCPVEPISGLFRVLAHCLAPVLVLSRSSYAAAAEVSSC